MFYVDKSVFGTVIFFVYFPQAVVWDEYLTGPFGLIAQYSLLKVWTSDHDFLNASKSFTVHVTL